MRVWRIDRAGRNPLEGTGGLHAGGRWNARGRPIVYASAHLSLAILEKLVHVNPDRLPDNLVAFEIELPDGDELTGVRSRRPRAPSGWVSPGCPIRRGPRCSPCRLRWCRAS